MAANPTQSPLAARPTAESEDPRARAARRIAELQGNWGSDTPPDADGTDMFWIDPEIIPDGWDYAWKTFSIFGKEEREYGVEIRIGGWEEVPAKRHPELMPNGWAGAFIERRGMILFERPMELTLNARKRDLRKAQMQVSNKEASLAGETAGAFDARKPTINRTSEAIAIPK